ncbi:MAG: hypothetical protein Q8M92_00630 [Candidatus Subteraquimicrobiales bacterium]|nr:hypothetical protein [Candidatus Subteraquimicrobiales bacterium]
MESELASDVRLSAPPLIPGNFLLWEVCWDFLFLLLITWCKDSTRLPIDLSADRQADDGQTFEIKV